MEVGTKFKIENTFLEGIHSREIFKIKSIDGNIVMADNLTGGGERRFLYDKDVLGRFSLKSLFEKGKTMRNGFIFSVVE